jgi:endonuclease VIII
MPEGDTIFRTAARLRPVLEGRRIDAAECRDPQLGAETLAGRQITAVEARGKHLLIHLDDARAIHSHLGMHGAWHVYRPGQSWQKPPAGRAMVANRGCPGGMFLSQDARIAERHRAATTSASEPAGPDLLAETLDETEVVRRLRMHPQRAIGEAIMDQTLVCGIGNVYKSEVLFLCRIDPFPRPDWNDQQIGK